MAEDPDQDLLNKLDRRESRSRFLSLAEALAIAALVGLVTFGGLRFGIRWSTESAVDVGALVGILLAVLLAVLLSSSRSRP